ncbi:hypothetical protein [Luteibacter sp.]|jgi:hypothetical protein|uniref:hypothetical protein n=1 Tax=Luteibacter sp. TaxID=1886636 RepID=UPI003F7FDE87
MDDRTYLLGKLAALEIALEAAISAHPEPRVLTLALCQAMARPAPSHLATDLRAFTEGWLAIVTPLLITHTKPVRSSPRRRTNSLLH